MKCGKVDNPVSRLARSFCSSCRKQRRPEDEEAEEEEDGDELEREERGGKSCKTSPAAKERELEHLSSE